MHDSFDNLTDTTHDYAGYVIPPCNCGSAVERLDLVAYPMAAFNVFSIFANIIHMVILSLIPSLKKSSYYHVLLHISISDIHYALYAICRLTLNRAEYFQNSPKFVYLIYDIIMTSADSNRYLILAMASFERYSALCRPMAHTTSKFTVYIHIWLPCSWIVIFVWTSIGVGVFHEDLCFNPLTGPSTAYGKVSGAVIILGAVGPCLLAIAALQTRVLAELLRMRETNITREQTTIRKATHSLLIIIGVFYLCLTPTMAAFLNRLYRGPTYRSLDYYLGSVLFSSLYGVVNTLIYGWMTPAYRHKVMAIRCSCPKRTHTET